MLARSKNIFFSSASTIVPKSYNVVTATSLFWMIPTYSTPEYTQRHIKGYFSLSKPKIF
jgi:hypothetical protein